MSRPVSLTAPILAGTGLWARLEQAFSRFGVRGSGDTAELEQVLSDSRRVAMSSRYALL